jgi:hypothetical protein
METCGLCDHPLLQKVYAPMGSSSQTVTLCPHCGCCQSLPRRRPTGPKTPSISGDADWGNLRIGKELRLPAHLPHLRDSLSGSQTTLDLGANRGAFARWWASQPHAGALHGIEPDLRLHEGLNGLYDRLWLQPVEEVDLPPQAYHFIYCVHTLEHLAEPRACLAQLHRSAAPDCHLFLEVPDLAFIGRPDVLEEFFLDKHLFHFSREHLGCLLAAAGWHPDRWIPDPLGENLTLIARPSFSRTDIPPQKEANSWRMTLHHYAQTLARNRAGLAQRIAALPACRNLVCFGGGRLFDLAFSLGGLRPQAVVDSHLHRHLKERHGVPFFPPDHLKELQPDLIVIASRGFQAEIREQIQQILPQAPPIFALFQTA